jgi:hypothetical protein
LTCLAENGLLTQARLILLDSPLMLATAFTAFAFTSFTNQQEQGPTKAFQPVWWFWLVMTGLGLGMTVSIKWVGLFTIAWVGSLTLVQLWVLLGDVNTVTPVSSQKTSCEDTLWLTRNSSVSLLSTLWHEPSLSLSSRSPSTWACSPFTLFAWSTREMVMAS